MLKDSLSRLYPHPELFKPPSVSDESLQFREDQLPNLSNVKPLYISDKKIRHATQHVLYPK